MQIIITGGIQSGKSTLASRLVQFLNDSGVTLSGIIALGLWQDDQRHGFDLFDLKTGVKCPLARRQADSEGSTITPFQFFDKGLAVGARALDKERCRDTAVIMVDEVGKLELAGEGWARFLDPLLSIRSAVHIWIVRENLVEKVSRRWNLEPVEIIHAEDDDSFEKLIFVLKKGSVL
ncbi:MAG: hypothetical protein J7L25_00170 [Deltaproteobacteria bacterium]|nr:hypothetical protein [Candidatus Tharpella aukensis]